MQNLSDALPEKKEEHEYDGAHTAAQDARFSLVGNSFKNAFSLKPRT